MKATGIVRKLDQLGRIVIPKEIRNVFDLKEADPVEIFVDDSNIILRKYEPSCIFCNSEAKDFNDIVEFGGKKVCKKCLAKLRNIK